MRLQFNRFLAYTKCMVARKMTPFYYKMDRFQQKDLRPESLQCAVPVGTLLFDSVARN